MTLQTLTILPDDTAPRRPSRRSPGRRFSAQLLGYLLTPNFDRSGPIAPAWIAFLGSDAALRPFIANARAGKMLQADNRCFALPKTLGHRWLWQRLPTSTAAVAYRPDLFHLDVARNSADSVHFLLAPDIRWLDQQALELGPHLPDASLDPRLAARAALFAAFLDRRSLVPVLRDLRFHLRLYRAALDSGALLPISSPHRYCPLEAHNAHALGFDDPASFLLDADALRDFLVDQTQAHFAEYPTPRRALPVAPALPALRPLGAPTLQLSLDFDLAPLLRPAEAILHVSV